MNKEQEQQILDYYSTTDKYIRSKTHSKELCKNKFTLSSIDNYLLGLIT
ncbi:hypothetical protein C806_05098 [Lachnospiraceae bacterium 3-1]|nr:hypothetical protein C806_05098 [Lachnospiraceae bacterium 3-1]